MVYSKYNLFSCLSKLNIQTGHRDLATFMSITTLSLSFLHLIPDTCINTTFQNQSICQVWGVHPHFHNFCSAGYCLLGVCVFHFTFLSSASPFSLGSLMLLVADHFSHLSGWFWTVIYSSVQFVSLPSLLPWTHIINVLPIPPCCINEYITANLLPGTKKIAFKCFPRLTVTTNASCPLG